MATIVKDETRRLIPRWRYFRDLPTSSEFAGNPLKKNTFSPDDKYLTEKLNEWRDLPSISTAAEVMSCAITTGKKELANECAKHLLDNHQQTTSHLVSMAEKIIRGEEAKSTLEEKKCSIKTLQVDLTTNARATIHTSRTRLINNPRNVIARIDMARAHAILGNSAHAIKEMDIALKLHPNHRNVLRSASRLFIHLEDVERAQRILTNNERTPHDPWLLAAEISTANIANKTSKYRNTARKLIDRRHIPEAHLCELQSALGTLDYFDGNYKNARKKLHKSLNSSSENVLAQARWLNANSLSLDISEDAWAAPLSYEAHCWKMIQDKDWDGAAEQCKKWLCDEPFSSRPARVGSSIGIDVLSNLNYAEECARIGLMSDPNDHILLNNLTVSLSYQNKINEAIQCFNKITVPLESGLSDYVYIATMGLLHFRIHNYDEGHKFYERAESLAPKEFKPLVIIHWAKEEAHAKTTHASNLLQLAKKVSDESNDDYIKKIHTELLNKEKQTSIIFSKQAIIDSINSNTLILPKL